MNFSAQEIDNPELEKTLLSVSRAAKILGVSASTLRRLEVEDKIKSVRLKNGYRVFSEIDVLNLKSSLQEKKTDKTTTKINRKETILRKKVLTLPTPSSITPKESPELTVVDLNPKTSNLKTFIKLLITKTNNNVRNNISNINLSGSLVVSFTLLVISLLTISMGTYFAVLKSLESRIEGGSENLGLVAKPYEYLKNIISPAEHNLDSKLSYTSDVLGLKDRVQNFVFYVNVPSTFKSNVNIEETLTVTGESNLNGGVTTPSITFTTPGSINNLQTIDTVSKTNLENILELTGDVTGPLSNNVIKDGAITSEKLADSIDYEGDFNFAGTWNIDGTEVTATAEQINILTDISATTEEINYLSGATAGAGGVIFGNGSAFTQDLTNFFWNDSLNRLGIGTNTPSASLHVAGNVIVTGTTSLNGVTYTWPSTDGSSGQFLSTNGTGTLSWDSPAGSGTVDGTGTASYLPLWTDSNTLTNSALYQSGSNIGIGTTTPSSLLHVAGTARATTFTDGTATLTGGTLDLGTNTIYDGNLTGSWAFNDGNLTGINQITADNTITFSGLGTGTDNTVVILNGSNQLTTDEIDSRVWGTSLVDAVGSTNYVPYFSDTDTLNISSLYYAGGNLGVGTTNPGYTLDVNGNIRIASGSDLYLGNIGLGNTGASALLSGASLVGVFDEFTNSNATNVQEALNDLDAAIGSGASKFTQDTGFIYLTNSTDQIVLGATTSPGGKLNIVGDADEIQLYVRGNSTQTNNLVLFEQSNGSDLLAINNTGDVLSGFTQLDGATQANGTGSSTNSLTVDNAANFNVGNYIRIQSSSPNCASGISTCYSKIRSIAGSVITLSNNLNWADNSTVEEFHIPEIGGTNTADTLTNRYGQGFFISGVVTGNASTFYADQRIYTTDRTGSNSDSLTINTGSTTGSGNSGDIILDPGSAAGTSGNIQIGTTNAGGIVIGRSGVSTTIAGSLTVNGQSFTDLTGNGLTISGNELTINLVSAADGLSSTTSSASGLEVLSSGLTLLQGCSTGQVLKWNESSDTWECANDTGAASAIINVENNDVAVGTNVDTLDFSTDFSLTASPSNEININVADDILNFTEFSDSLVLDANTTFNLYNGSSAVNARFYNSNSSNEMLFLDSSTGYVGIGTTAPTYKLEVAGATSISTTGNNSKIEIGPSLTDGWSLITGVSSASTGDWFLGASDDLDVNDFSLGTTNSSSNIVFAPDRTERVRISTAGYLGVGTTDPSALLSVGSTNQFRVDSSGNITRINNVAYSWPGSQAAGSNYVLTNNGSGTLSWNDLTGIGGLDGSGTANYLPLWSDTNTLTSSSIYQTGGNVGIGTTNPLSTLTVSKTGGVGGYLPTSGSTPTNSLAQFKNSAVNNALYIGTAGTSPYGGWLQVSDATNLSVQYPLLLNPNGGNVGIGTTNPGSKLQVAGLVTPSADDSYDLGTTALQWQDLFLAGDLDFGTNTITDGILSGNWAFSDGDLTGINSITADNTITFSGLGTGTDNTVVILNSSNQLTTDEIDSRVWGTSLVDGSATANYIPYMSDSDSLGNSVIYQSGSNIGIGTTAPSQELHVAGDIQIQDNSFIGLSSSTARIDFDDQSTDEINILDANLGVGTTAPSSLLSVGASSQFRVDTSGNLIRINNIAYSWPGSQAAADNYVLVNDSNGNLTWEDVSGIGGVNGSGTTNYVPLWSDSNTLSNSGIYQTGGNIGIGTTAPSSILDVAGTLTATTFYDGTARLTGGTLDLGTNTIFDGNFNGNWAFNNGDLSGIDAITSGGTITFSGLGTGTDNTVVILNSSNQLTTDEIDSRVWGTSLVDGTATSNYIPYMSDADSLANSSIYYTGGNLGIGTTAPTYNLEVAGDIMVNNNGKILFTESDLYFDRQGSNTIRFMSDGRVRMAFGADEINIDSNGAAVDFRVAGTSDDYTFFVDSSAGRVGIGTSGPSEELEVAGDIAIRDNSFIGLSSSTARIDFDDQSTDEINILSANLGVGTTAPSSLLSVGAASEFRVDSSGNLIRINNVAYSWPSSQAAADNYVLTNDSNGNLTWESVSGLGGVDGTGTTNYLPLWSDSNTLSNSGIYQTGGNIGIGTTAPSSLLHVNGVARVNSLNVAGVGVIDYSSGVFRFGPISNDYEMALWTNSAERVRVDNSGNFGIGTTDPSAMLSVGSSSQFRVDSSGNLTRVNNIAYSWPGSQASSDNYVLTNDGSGNLTWESVTGAGGLDGNGTANYVARWQDSNTLTTGVLYDNGTNIGIGTTAPSEELDVVGDIAIRDNSFIGLSSSAARIDFDDQSTDEINILSANLGVGTTAPSSLLSVGASSQFRVDSSGNLIRVNDVAYSWPSSQAGGSNYVLTNNGSGTLSWTSVSGVGAVNGSGTTNYLPIWTGSSTLSNSGLYQTGGNIGIGTTAPSSLLHVAGTLTATTFTDGTATLTGGTLDLGTNTIYDGNLTGSWAFNDGNLTGINSITADNTITFTGLGTGTDNTVVILNSSNQLTTDEIDSRVWGTSLVDGSATANYIPYMSDGDSLANSSIYYTGGNLGIGTTAPSSLLHVAGTSRATTFTDGTATLSSGTLDLGTNTIADGTLVGNWAFSDGNLTGINQITADNTITFSGLGTGTDNTVVILNGSNQLTTDEIDSRVWGTSLVDGSGTANYLPLWSDSNTVASSLIYQTGGNIGIGTTSPSQELEVVGDIAIRDDSFIGLSSSTARIDFDDQSTDEINLLSANVGIGTTAPSSLLSVGASSQFRVDSSGNLIRINNIAYSWPSAQAAGDNYVLTNDGSGSLAWTSVSGVGAVDGSGTANYITRWTDGNTLTNSGMYQSGSNIGIGTTAPSSLLHVAGTLTATTFTDGTATLNGGTLDLGTNTIYDGNLTGSWAFNDGNLTGINSITADNTITFSGLASSSTENTIVVLNGSNQLEQREFSDFLSDNGVLDGTGTTNYLPLWSDSNTLTSSGIYQTGGNLGIGTTAPAGKLQILSNNVFNGEAGALNLADSTTSTKRLYMGFDATIDAGYIQSTQGGVGWKATVINPSGGNVGIGTTTPSALFSVGASNQLTINTSGALTTSGTITANGTLDANGTVTLGDNGDTIALDSSDWDINATGDASGLGAITADGTITFSGLGTGTDNTVVILNSSNQLTTDEIDSRVWGSTLVDGAGTTNYLPYYSDSDTLAISGIYQTGGNIGIGTTAPSKLLEVNSTSEQLRLGYSESVYTDLFTNSNGYFGITPTGSRVGIGTTAPSSLLHVAGTATATTFTDGTATLTGGTLDLGTNTIADGTLVGNWAFSDGNLTGINQITADNTITFSGLASSSTENTIVVLNGSNQLEQREFSDFLSDNGVLDGTGTANYLPLWSDTNTLTSSLLYQSGSNIGIGLTNPSATLSLGSGTGDRLALWDNGSNKYGFGIQSNLLQIYVPTSSDSIGLGNGTSASFSQTMTIKGSNVGIGTTGPNDTLEILSTTDAQLRLAYNSSNYQALQVASDGGLTWSALGSDADLNFDFSGATDGDFSVNTNDIFVDTSVGNVGIGTASPNGNAALDVNGDLYISDASNPSIVFSVEDNALIRSNNGMYFDIDADNDSSGMVFGWRNNGSTLLATLTEAGNFGIGSDTTPDGLLDVNDLFIVQSGGNVGVGTTGPSSLFSVGATSQFRVDSSGNLIRINDVAYSWPGSQAAANNYVLVNDGSGNLTWEDISSAGGLDGAGTTNYLPLWSDSNTLTSSGLYQTGGNLGIGTTAPSKLVEILSTSEQLRLGYSESVYTDLLTNSSGYLGISPTGGRVGIGTTAPGASLEVLAGKIQVGNTFGTAVETEGILLGDDNAGAGRSVPLEFLSDDANSGSGYRIQARDQGGSQFNLIISNRSNSGTWTDIAAFASNSTRFGIGDLTPDATLDVDGAGNFDISAGSAFTIDADTADATVDPFVLDVGTLTNGIDAANINLDVTGNTANDADTFSALSITASNNATDQTTDDNIYGLYVNDLGGTAKAGNEYGIYQAGTSWDYGLYITDDAWFNAGLNLAGTLDLGTNTIYDGNLTGSWALNDGDLTGINSITADNTITFSGLGTGTDNTVVILNSSNQLTTDEIDSRVWGTTLVDGAGTANYLPYYSDSDTLAISNTYYTGGNLGIGTTAPSKLVEILSTSEQLRLGYSESVYTDLFTNSNGYLGLTPTGSRVGIGTTAPTSTLDINSGTTNAIGLTRSSAGQWLSFNDGTDSWGLYNYAGSPESNLTANTGALAMDTTNGTLYVKTDDGDATGWTNLATGGTTLWSDGGTYIYADNATSTVITDAGYIGIGTTGPVSELQIAGTTPQLWIGDGGAEDTSIIFDGNAQDFYFALNDTQDDLIIGTGSTIGANALFTIENGGNVGIGLTNPSASLHILDTTEQLRLGYDSSNYTSFTIDSSGNLTIADSGNTVATFGQAQAAFEVPASFNAVGDVSIANDIIFTSQNSNSIKSYGPLTLESGEIFENNNLTLTTYGTGNIVANLGTGTTNPNAFIPGIDDVHDIGSSTYRWDDVYATNGTIQTSDERLKENVTGMTYGLSEIMQLRPVSYTWIGKPEKGTKLGLIAQETINVIPEVVDVPSAEEGGYWGLRYSDLVPVLVKGIQEQQAQIQTLQEQITGTTETEGTGSLVAQMTKIFEEFKQFIQTLGMSSTTDEEGNVSLVLNNDVNILGDATLSNTVVTGSFNIGSISIDSLENSISTIGQDEVLYIQKGPLAGNLDIFNGKIVLEKDGTIRADKVVAGTYSVREDSETVGSGVIEKNTKEITIESAAVKETSRIFITATTSTKGNQLYVSSKNEGESFVVKIDTSIDSDIEFDWWIVDTE